MRARVLRELLPRAQVGFYGSPNGPDAFAGENFTLSMVALREAATRGIFDRISFLMPVLYFGVNASHPDHTKWTEAYSNTTIAAALTLRTSAGLPIPIFVNTKFTYAKGPMLPPYEGFVEPATTKRLVQLWRGVPLVRRIIWWFYPDYMLQRAGQPDLTAIKAWWEKTQPVPPDCF